MSVNSRIVDHVQGSWLSVSSLAVVCATVAWTARSSPPFSEFVWTAIAAIMTAGFAIAGVVASREWKRMDEVWLLATFSSRSATILARLLWANGAIVAACLLTGLALWPTHWIAASPGRTFVWFFTVAAAAANYFAIGYTAGILAGRVSLVLVTMSWASAFVDVPLPPQLAGARTALTLVLPPLDLYAPRYLWADYPMSVDFVLFVGVHSASFILLAATVSYLLLRRADLPRH